ncbi:MAG: bacteriohemerythrin [Firmicutes bacterium]|jgi:hemerythrin|nr:bacteriohemerythrin [Bacillota bacterium]
MFRLKDGYETGIERIDKEHKEIIDAFEELYNRMHRGEGHNYYDDLLEFLDKYVDEHFKNEEDLQEEIDYPDIEEHKNIHKSFRDTILSIEEKHKNKEVTNKDLIEINLMIKEWLVNHILVEDKKLAGYIKSNNISIEE